MKDYIINENTLYIIGIDYKCSRVVEKEREFLVNSSIHSIIDKNCLYFGSSFQGRYDSSKYLLNRDYKLPILIKNKDYSIYMPLKSIFKIDCIWVSFNNILNYKDNNGKTYVNFCEYGEVDFDVSIKSFESLMAKSCVLYKNINFNEKNT